MKLKGSPRGRWSRAAAAAAAAGAPRPEVLHDDVRRARQLEERRHAARLAQALGPVANCTGACVPFNIFGGAGSVTPEMLNWVGFDERSRSQQRLEDYTFNLSGELFDLPGGPVGVAMGYEHRYQQGSFTPDPVIQAGLGADIPAQAARGAFNVDEVYGELRLPLLKDIPFQSHCEHHMAPIIGKAHIAYLPKDRVVGISKLARVLHGFARRLQVQERLTAEVADCIWTHLHPVGVAVVIEASHACMSARGVNTPGVSMTTSRMMGVFRDDEKSRREVLALMGL